MPAPTWMWATPSLSTRVRMVIAVSRSPSRLKKPIAPPYGPRWSASSSAMISMARIFGAPVSVPAGKQARRASIGRRLGLQLADDVGHDVHDVRVALDLHQPRHADRARLGDAADVVAAEVDQHDVLGALLLVGEQARGQRFVLLGRVAARHRAGDRSQW